MSKIDTLIQELQVKKSKIDYLSYVKKTLTEDTQCPDYISVKGDVLKLLTPEIDKLIQSIEDGTLVESTESLTSSEIKVLKTVVAKVVNKPIEVPRPQQSVPIKNETPPPLKNIENNPETQEVDMHLKMQFALTNRDLGGKTAAGPDGFTGTVVGLDAPNVIIQNTEGQKRKFKRNEITVL